MDLNTLHLINMLGLGCLLMELQIFSISYLYGEQLRELNAKVQALLQKGNEAAV